MASRDRDAAGQAREAILGALRRAAPPPAPAPDLAHLGMRFDDPAGRFGEAVAAVGGTCLRVPDPAAAHAALAELPAYRDARQVVSLVPAVGRSDIDLRAIADPHRLDRLDLSILPGEIAVAENGAVWIDGAALAHPAVFVIAEHLVLVVGADRVVHDMHEAYARLESRPSAYGTFIAGPSKTADIEQALVVGAHGARSLTVLLIG
jgi:L-lactate dehydrogenase complex protein LldG